MANDFKRGIRIYLETSEYQAGIDAMAASTKKYEARLAELNTQSNELTVSGKNQGKEWKKLQKEIERTEKQLQKSTSSEAKYRQQMQETERVLKNLNSSTYDELSTVRNKLRKDLRSLDRETEKYKNTKEQLIRVDKELAVAQADLNTQIGCQGTFMGRAANTFNKYFGLITSFAASITGLSMTFRKLAQDVAQMDDVYADVMKTTNMTREQVLDLNEEFKRMDTRTARDELNRLARDAGKLGINGKKNILDFVEAGNQIHVALGEDLGEGAIKSIGKMVGVFQKSTKQLQGLDLKGQMLSASSAVNELGMSSTANEKYLVDFAGRLGGVAKQAGISMAAILGFASSLDQDMQKVEMSATALQKFIMKLMGEPAKFAKMAGQDVKEFTTLLRNDANEAIKVVLRSLNEKGGFQQLIPIFQEMGLDGARAVGVLSALAGSIDQVEEAQRIANKAMAEGTSVTDEYNIKNENLQAQLEKRRKEFKEVALELGESLNPVLLKSTKATTYLVKALVELPKWLKENWKLIVSLVSIMTAYTTIVARHTIVTKANTIAVNLQKSALVKLFRTLLKNPYTFIATAIATATVAIYKFITATTQAERAMKDFQAEAQKETLELNNIFIAYKKANEGTDEKRRLLELIKEKYGPYLKDLIDEKGNITDIDIAQRQANAALREQIALKIQNASINDLTTKEVEKQADILNNIREHVAKEKGSDIANIVTSEIGTIFSENTGDLRTAYTLAMDVLRKYGFQPMLKKGMFSQSLASDLSDLRDSFIRINNGTQAIKNNFMGIIQTSKDVAGILTNNENSETETTDTDSPDEQLSKEQAKALAKLLKNTQILIDVETQAHNKRLKEANLFEVELSKLTEEKLRERLALDEQYYANLDRIAKESEETRFRVAKEEIGVNDIEPSTLKGDRLKAYEILVAQHEANLLKIEQDGQNRRKNSAENADKARLKVLADGRDAMLKTNEGIQKAELITLQQQFTNKEITQEEYNRESANIELRGLQERLKILQEYGKLLVAMEGELTDEQIKALQDNAAAIEAVTGELQGKSLKDEQDFQNNRKSIIEQFGLSSIADRYRIERDALKQAHAQGLLDEQEYQMALFQLRLKYAQEYINEAQKYITAGTNLVSAMEEAQTAKIEAEYTKRQSALTEDYNNKIISEEDYNAQKEQLEYEQKSAELEIQKKYADANFAMQAAQITASTALGIVQAWASCMELGPIAGPIAAGVLTGVLVGTAAAQIASASAERDRVKALTLESSSGGSGGSQGARVVTQAATGRYDVIGEEDGKTYRNVPYRGVIGTGIVDSPTLISEQGSEVIIDNPTLRNIQMNAPYIIDKIHELRVPQRASGNYDTLPASNNPSSAFSNNTVYDEAIFRAINENIELNNRFLEILLSTPLKSFVVLSEFEAKQALRNKSIKKGSI